MCKASEVLLWAAVVAVRTAAVLVIFMLFSHVVCKVTKVINDPKSLSVALRRSVVVYDTYSIGACCAWEPTQ
ncbi:hypothetical protein Cenrod_1600 [Candidatus Symbiobacter mobilis CR]|uniref:Uncharacterized protein n=1 Tax=Candidatus Symbiobacter mobilis CR TaxID=946483 RepID=U5N8N8_9BURK|nr:hypothetical protein Cenrod_1600 [Candidatus Symbiobacter mobilis CR]